MARRAPELHYTAYALWGLQVARAAGLPGGGRRAGVGCRYLKARLAARRAVGRERAPRSWPARAATRAFAALRAGRRWAQGRPGALARLYERRRAAAGVRAGFPARALAAAERNDLARRAGRRAGGAGPRRTGPAVVRGGRRGPGLVLELGRAHHGAGAARRCWRSAPAGTRPCRGWREGLLGARVDGRWPSTQDNVYSVLALAELAKARAAAGDGDGDRLAWAAGCWAAGDCRGAVGAAAAAAGRRRARPAGHRGRGRASSSTPPACTSSGRSGRGAARRRASRSSAPTWTPTPARR